MTDGTPLINLESRVWKLERLVEELAAQVAELDRQLRRHGHYDYTPMGAR